MDRKGSGQEMLTPFPGLCAARKSHIWNERDGGHGRFIHREWALLVLIQHLWLCLLPAPVSHVKERGEGKNRKQNNGTHDTC